MYVYRNNIITKCRSIKKNQSTKTFILQVFCCAFLQEVSEMLAIKRVLRHIFGNMLRQKKHVQRFSKGVSKM